MPGPIQPAPGTRVEDVYERLREVARALLSESPGGLLQPTAAVHEVYLKLAGREGWWADEAHLLAVAAKALRQVLVDHHRASRRLKRGGGGGVRLDTTGLDVGRASADLLEVEEALTRLSAVDGRAAEVVELRFFGGMSCEQIARRLGVSAPTVQRDWRFARAWLHSELGEEGGKR